MRPTLFPATLAGSLPKPEWLAETHKLWPRWKAQGAERAAAQRDATLLWLKLQEDAGLDVVTDGEQSRQHFVHGFLCTRPRRGCCVRTPTGRSSSRCPDR